MIILFLLFVAGLGATKYYQITSAMAANAHSGPPPQAITTIKVTESSWADEISTVGTLSPSQGVMLSAEEDGNVVKIGFESGAEVKKGDLLVQIDTSVEEAQLQSAQARLELARINLKRVQGLYTKSAMSESSLNNAVSEAKAAEGDANAIKAIIERKTIYAPFDGRTGIRVVNLGQYLQKGTPIVPLHQIDLMYLDFSIPQQNLSLLHVGQEVEFSVDVYEEKIFKGIITAIDTEVNEATRNFKVQATVQNADKKLRPGIFANIRILYGDKKSVMAIPASSINYAPYGDSVYVVTKIKAPDGSEFEGVKQQFVQLGASRGDQIIVASGLVIGEEIATSGIFKLGPDFPVIINNSVQPGNERNPKPEDA